MPRGGKREGAGRKPLAERQTLVQKLSPYEDKVLQVIVNKALQGDAPFVKLYMEYLHGKPTQTVEATNTNTIRVIDESTNSTFQPKASAYYD